MRTEIHHLMPDGAKPHHQVLFQLETSVICRDT
jgi:hypothetical protein